MEQTSFFQFDTEFGKMGVAADAAGITNVYLPGEIPETPLPRSADGPAAELSREAARRISEYFQGSLREFSLPLSPAGTVFMQTVWDELCAIPYGETATYARIAARAGRPRAFRAVGLACNRNPVPIIIPCHRVVGSSGGLTGYRGGLIMKERLLALEAGQTRGAFVNSR